jgi:hypothetical protein
MSNCIGVGQSPSDPDAVAAQLVEVVAAGFTVLMLGVSTVADQEVLARDVLPQVRAEVAERGLPVAGS